MSEGDLHSEQITAEASHFARINQSLQSILAVNSNNPFINKLQAYTRNSLPQDLNFVTKPDDAMKEKADLLFHEFENEKDMAAGFFQVIANLENTPYLAQVADENIHNGLANGLHNGKYAARVKFVNPDTPFIKVIKKLTDPQYYNGLLDTVVLPVKIPKASEFWRMLISEGKLPEVVAILDKALVSDLQFTKAQRAIMGPPLALRFMVGNVLLTIPWPTGWFASTAWSVVTMPGVFGLNYFFGNDQILSTVHAAEAAFYSPTSMDETKSLDDVRKSIVDKFKQNEKREKAESAFDLVHRLRILGDMNDIDIGRLVSGAKYDKTTHSFPTLKRKLDILENKWGLNDPDSDKEKIIPAIQAKYELSLLYARRQAQELAFQILQDARGRWLIPALPLAAAL